MQGLETFFKTFINLSTFQNEWDAVKDARHIYINKKQTKNVLCGNIKKEISDVFISLIINPFIQKH